MGSFLANVQSDVGGVAIVCIGCGLDQSLHWLQFEYGEK
ncbi:hypothetical protein ABH955_000588 [Bacillus sp. RC240]